MPRTYDNALHLLSLLPTNKDVVSLFASAPTATSSGDLNALAIPEMLAWLRRAGYTPADLASRHGLRCVHVAGTKGKGSTCALTAAVLAHPAHSEVAGRVGAYLSPHVVSVRERIVLDGAPIGRGLFARYVFEVWERLSDAARREAEEEGKEREEEEKEKRDEAYFTSPSTKPFYFRFLTLVALHAFAREGVRSAVVECGIGGEYDATNVLGPESVTAAVVTRLGVDHVAMLGATVEEIAWHKAGIFRRGVGGFTVRYPEQDNNQGDEGDKKGGGGGGGGGVMGVLRARAAEKGALFLREIPAAEVEAWEGVPGARLEGDFQKYNMALAAAAARHHLAVLACEAEAEAGADETKRKTAGEKLRAEAEAFRLDALPPAYIEAMRSAGLRGRCETVTEGKGASSGLEWFLDGAHTADSLAQVARLFAGKYPRKGEKHLQQQEGKGRPCCRILVFNQQERDAAALVRALLGGIEQRGAAGAAGDGPFFDYALFTCNDVFAPAPIPPPPSSSSSSDAPAPPPQRADLSAQEAAMAAMRGASPETECAVFDNVADAASRARELAAAFSSSSSSSEGEGEAGGDCKVLVTGSFHLVRAALQVLDAEFEA